MEGFGRWIRRLLGIPIIEPDLTVSSEPDEVYRASLENLEIRRQKLLADLEHLNSRHEFLLAVVKTAPYAIVTSFVAVGWAVLGQAWAAVAMLLLFAFATVILVVASNRYCNEAETTIGRKKLDSLMVEERYRVKKEEVRQAIQKAGNKVPDLFAEYTRVSFDPTSSVQYTKQLQTMLPPAESQIYANMRHCHRSACDIATELHSTAAKFIVAIVAWRNMVKTRMKSIRDQKGTPNLSPAEMDQYVTEFSQSLLICIAANALKKTRIDDMREQNKISEGLHQQLLRLAVSPFVGLFSDKDLRAKATEIEELRKKGEEKSVELRREVGVLYGQG